MIMLTIIRVFFLLSLTIFVNAADLETRFKVPPRDAKPQTWWHWFGGNVTKEGITKDLEAMSRVGIGGVQNFHVKLDTPQGPVAYDSPEWHELIKYTISEAARLDIEYGFHNCAGWSSTGGPWITPEHAMKQVVWTEQILDIKDSSGTIELEMETPLQNRDFYSDIAVIAFPALPSEEPEEEPWLIDNWKQKSFKYPNATLTITPSRLIRDERIAPNNAIINSAEIIDVTQYAKGNAGELSIPSTVLTGHERWTVIRFGYTATDAMNSPADGDGSGLECDKMSTQALDIHWDHLIAAIKKDAGENEDIFTNILVDSFEQNYQNWTKGFETEFSARRTYQITRWLPALTGRVINSVDQSERFLWDFRKTCAELINENYFGHFAKRAHEADLYLAVESYGMGNFDELGAALIADMPMGEFWAGRAYDERTARAASSAGNIMGRKFTGAEAFTAHGMDVWTTHPESLKAQGDFFLAKGINRFIYHTYVHQPWGDNIKPGMNMGRFGFNFNRNNTWFEKSKPYLSYMARAQSMLQAGRAVKDILYVYGEEVPTDSQIDSQINPVAPAGYGFDKAGHQVLKMADVKDGKITFPSRMQYSVLALTHAERTSPSLLKEVKRLVDLGAKIVAERPIAAPGLDNYPASDAQVAQYIEQLWESGLVKPHSALPEILNGLKLEPDFSVEPAAGIEFIHRKDEDAEWYFVANINPWQKELKSTFRVSGKIPEIWDPETGEIWEAPVWREDVEGRTTVQLSLSANQSLFVVFRKTTPSSRSGIVSAEFKKRTTPTTDQDNALLSATYGVADDASKQINVTQQLLDAMEKGQPNIVASNQLSDGKDPAFGFEKTLRVEGRVSGKNVSISAAEGQSLDISLFSNAGVLVPSVRYLSAYRAAVVEPGALDVTYSDGTTRQIVSKGATITKLANPWEIQFGEFGSPSSVTFSALIPWNEHADEKIKYFSGTATYRTSFNFKKTEDSQEIMLDLGRVHNLATVILNGKNLGVYWKAPFLVDIQNELVNGENQLEVQVTNLQVNRVIGDEQHPEIETVRRTDGIDGELQEIPGWVVRGEMNPDEGRNLFFTFKFFNQDSPLLDSGLLGDVRIIEPDVVTIQQQK